MMHKFRVWQESTQEYITDGDYFGDGAGITLDGKFSICRDSYFGCKKSEPDYRVEQWTGLTDINGQEIYEGDTVVVYPSNYETTLIENDGFTHPVYFADTEKPLPLKDIVVFKGKVVWSAPEFRVEVEGNENGVSSISFYGYWCEVLKD